MQGNVEVWLGDLLRISRASLHKIIRDGAIAIQDPTFNLLDFLNSFPAQVRTLLDQYRTSFHDSPLYLNLGRSSRSTDAVDTRL